MKLAERRITHDVIMTFDIKPLGDGWTYPTPHGALRFKNANSDAPNKYAWIGDKRDTLLYGFDLREAIQQAGGHVWLVTEFDFFAMRSAGIFHVIAQLQGEGSIPNDLPAFLQSMSALVCHIAPDRDNAGLTWAQLVANKLIPAGIQVYARELPYPHEKKNGGDIGRLWQEYNIAQSFERFLLTLPVTKLQVKNEVKRKKAQRDYIIPEDRKARIARALGITSYNQKGYSKNITCPFHDDTKPSAALHREFGLHCFREDKWYRWRDLADVIGMKWETTIPVPLYREIALGDELIQEMVKAGYSTLAFVLETAYRAGWMPKQEITIQSLCTLGMPTWRARKAFAQMDGREADKRKRDLANRSFCGELASFFLLHKEGTELNKNSKRGRREGRPRRTKVLPHPDDLARLFDVKVTRYTKIAEKPNIADWRAEVYALPIDRDPGSYPRRELCRPLGISATTGRAYDKRACVTVTPNVKRVELKSADGLPDTPVLKGTWLETEEVIMNKKGKEKFRQFTATKLGYSRALKNAKEHGGSVWLVKSLANDYERRKE
jgi:hypothetical protein